MVFYQNRVRNKFTSNNKIYGGGVKRYIPSMFSVLNDNRYTVGTGVGALNTFNRRALIRRASTCNNLCK